MRRHRCSLRATLETLIAIVVVLSTVSCAGLQDGRGTPSDVTASPCEGRAGRAAAAAALAPETWVPVVAALALQLGDADDELSDWAMCETPVFGSTDNARQMSDVLFWTTVAGYGVTTLAAHDQDEPAVACPVSTVRRLAVGAAASLVTSGSTQLLKEGTVRLRPDESNRHSFPSAHSSGAAVNATLAARNTEWTSMSRRSAALVRGGLAVAAVATAWARVEGGRHYPSDVLVGLALGHFVGAFLNDTFLGHGPGAAPAVALWLTHEEAELTVRWSF